MRGVGRGNEFSAFASATPLAQLLAAAGADVVAIQGELEALTISLAQRTQAFLRPVLGETPAGRGGDGAPRPPPAPSSRACRSWSSASRCRTTRRLSRLPRHADADVRDDLNARREADEIAPRVEVILSISLENFECRNLQVVGQTQTWARLPCASQPVLRPDDAAGLEATVDSRPTARRPVQPTSRASIPNGCPTRCAGLNRDESAQHIRSHRMSITESAT